MQPLAERQREFSAALLNAGAALPPGLVGPDGQPSARRFGVYRNNVISGLSEALARAYPAVHRIVGEDFFRAMARVYVISEPPRSPLLLEYGLGLPEFIEGFPPAASVPYLADVARIERAWMEAFHAADAAPPPPAALATVPPDRLAGLRFSLHPSLRIVRSRLPALTIWRMNVADGVPRPVDLGAGGEDCVIVRPAADVLVRLVAPGGFAFMRALMQGALLGEAAAAAGEDDQRFDLSENLTLFLAVGAFVGLRPTDPESETAAQ